MPSYNYRKRRQRHWILYLTGSPIKNVGGQASRMTEKGKKRPWISDQVRNDRKGTDTSGLENLGYQRTKRVDD